jgi:hypothetical protein
MILHWIIVGVCVGVGLMLSQPLLRFVVSNKIKVFFTIASIIYAFNALQGSSEGGEIGVLAIIGFFTYGILMAIEQIIFPPSPTFLQEYVRRFGTKK